MKEHGNKNAERDRRAAVKHSIFGQFEVIHHKPLARIFVLQGFEPGYQREKSEEEELEQDIVEDAHEARAELYVSENSQSKAKCSKRKE